MSLKQLLYIFISIIIVLMFGLDMKFKCVDNHKTIIFNKTNNQLLPLDEVLIKETKDLMTEHFSLGEINSQIIELFKYHETLKLPNNKIKVTSDSSLYIEKPNYKYDYLNITYGDGDKIISVPYKWENNKAVNFDLSVLNKNKLHMFQIIFINQYDLDNSETYLFKLSFI